MKKGIEETIDAVSQKIKEGVSSQSQGEAERFLHSVKNSDPGMALYLIMKSKTLTDLTHNYADAVRKLLDLREEVGEDLEEGIPDFEEVGPETRGFISRLNEAVLLMVDNYERLSPFREKFKEMEPTEPVEITLHLLEKGERIKASGIGNHVAATLSEGKAIAALQRQDMTEAQCLGYCELLLIYTNLLKWTSGEQRERVSKFLQDVTLLLVLNPEKYSAAAGMALDRVVLEDAEVEGVGGELLLAMANTDPRFGEIAASHSKFRERINRELRLGNVQMKQG